MAEGESIGVYKTDEFNSAYQERTKNLAEEERDRYVFGLDTLETLEQIDTLPENILTSVYKTDSRDEAKVVILDRSRKELAKLFANKKLKPYVGKLLSDARGDPDFQQILADTDTSDFLLQPMFITSSTITDRELLPDAVYRGLLEQHKKNYERRREEIELQIPTLKEQLMKKLTLAMAEGEFFIDPIVLRDRMQNTQFLVKDALLGGLDETLGMFDADMNTIVLAEQLTDQDLQHTFDHEMLHALSGRTILSRFEADIMGSQFEHQRIGLRFAGPFGRFRWMNEAETERLNIRINGLTDSRFYRAERDLLEALRESGNEAIPQRAVADAYFENYDPNQQQGTRIPAWHSLQQRINTAYEPGVLVEVDRYVRFEGAASTTAQLRENWKEFIPHSEEEKEDDE